jgi:hypothetical protein
VKTILTVATIAVMAISAPAFAQSSGAPGATGDSGPLTGHNTPGGAADKSMASPNGGSMKMHEGRAATPDTPAGDKADDTPKSVRGDQGKAK